MPAYRKTPAIAAGAWILLHETNGDLTEFVR